MTDPRLLAERLRVHQALYQELLQLVEQENQALRGPDSPYAFCHRRRQLLPELARTLDELKDDRRLWLTLDLAERQRYPEMPALMTMVSQPRARQTESHQTALLKTAAEMRSSPVLLS